MSLWRRKHGARRCLHLGLSHLLRGRFHGAPLGDELADGSTVMAHIGAVAVSGRLEANPGDFRDSTGRGASVGVSWERIYGAVPLRVDLNYDSIRSDSDPTYERSLDMIGLRVSYMF